MLYNPTLHYTALHYVMAEAVGAPHLVVVEDGELHDLPAPVRRDHI